MATGIFIAAFFSPVAEEKSQAGYDESAALTSIAGGLEAAADEADEQQP